MKRDMMLCVETAGQDHPPFLRDFLHGHYLRGVSGSISCRVRGCVPLNGLKNPCARMGHGAFGDNRITGVNVRGEQIP